MDFVTEKWSENMTYVCQYQSHIKGSAERVKVKPQLSVLEPVMFPFSVFCYL